MKALYFCIFMILTLNLHAHSSIKNIDDRLIKLETQSEQLDKIIEGKSNLLNEKQKILSEQEKKINTVTQKCETATEKIYIKIKDMDVESKRLYEKSEEKVDTKIKALDTKSKDLDKKFRGLYEEANYGIIGIFIAIILAILYICRMLGKGLDNLEENYTKKIDAIESDVKNRVGAMHNSYNRRFGDFIALVESNAIPGADSEEIIMNTETPFPTEEGQ